MAWVVGTGAFFGLLAIAWGSVTLRTGWILPMARRNVTRPRLQGLGIVFEGTAVLLQGLFYSQIVPSVSWEVRFFGGNALAFTGILFIALSQLLPRRRGPDQAAPSDV